jgi:chemotaxis protein CheX
MNQQMGVCMDPRSNGTAMALPEVLDLNAAGPLAHEILANRGQPLILDASSVRRLGALGLQVLMSARNTWEHDGAPFAVANPSEAFSDALAAFGAEPFPAASAEAADIAETRS